MDQVNIRQCEEEFIESAKEVDLAEFEYSQTWIIERVNANSDKQADHATVITGFHMNELRARRDVARLRLENAYASKEGK